MVQDDTIRAVEIQETDFGENVVLESPYEAKEFINALPWKELQEEVAEHGSLRDKLEGRGVEPAAIDAAEAFSFSDDFAAHSTWEPNARGYEEGAWVIDVEAFEEAAEFFEFAGYRVKIDDGVEL